MPAHVPTPTKRSPIRTAGGAILVLGLCVQIAGGRPSIRSAFFEVYPAAVGSGIDTVPSHPNHCGVCHYDFAGAGARNPYGIALGNALPGFPNNPNGRRQAVRSIETLDSDGDSYTTLTEVTNRTTYVNTPTFPGLTPANVGNVLNVALQDIQGLLVPNTGADNQPPAVTVIMPNGGQTYVSGMPTTVAWTATDPSGIAAVDVYLSDDNGITWRPVEMGLPNTGSLTWFPPNRPTAAALIRVAALDNSFMTGSDVSDAPFAIQSAPGGLVPTTLRDFDMPGSQPFEAGTLNDPAACAVCHGGYDAAVEPYANWKGSMMAQASLDPLFEACLAVANQDAPESGDLCLRCHIPKAWLRGRSVPTGGSRVLATDKSGVSCDLCHRMVDPIFDPTLSPSVDAAILASLSLPGNQIGNGMYVIDPTGARRGPFPDATSGHPVVVSPFHREAALCGTCHDVSNPAFERDANGNYIPNAFDSAATDLSSTKLMPIERTYSEWFHSAYNTPGGVYAPQFGGNREYVATCQDCHLRAVTGYGCNYGAPPLRTDLPLHDMTGGSTWLTALLPELYPTAVDAAAAQAAVLRSRYMLRNAASLAAVQEGTTLRVTVTNETGHKLPTGYPEGRRIWINVKFFDSALNLLAESGQYDPTTGALVHDAHLRVYEAKPGLDHLTAPLVGAQEGPSFHFVLNNRIFKDNRIPPRGFTNAAFSQFGGSPVGATYADGQYWDDVSYPVPAAARSARITLYYQSTTREYVEFLRDHDTTTLAGQTMFQLWDSRGKCPPETMATLTIALSPPAAPGDFDGDDDCDVSDFAVFQVCFNGPGNPAAQPGCDGADFDDDGDVDVGDFASFQVCFNGADRPPACL